MTLPAALIAKLLPKLLPEASMVKAVGKEAEAQLLVVLYT